MGIMRRLKFWLNGGSEMTVKWRVMGIFFFILMCCGCGCGKGEEKERGKVLSEAMTVYKGELPVLAYTVDGEGNLYTVGNETDGTQTDGSSFYVLRQYDREQNLLWEYSFDSSFAGMDALAVQGRTVYFTASRAVVGKGSCISLCALDMDLDKIDILSDYTFYDRVHQMLLLDGRLYLLGGKDYSVKARRPGGGDGYPFYEDRLVYYDLSEKESYAVAVEYPIRMAFAGDGSMMIHAYMDGEGYQLLQYNPVQDSIRTAVTFDGCRMTDFAICHDGKDLIYSYSVNSRGLVLAALDDLGSETELCPSKLLGSRTDTKLLYQDGEVFFLDGEDCVVRFALADVYRGNEAIRYISPGYEIDAPYGCGYTMQRQELSEDKFVLKVLAQDSDYDLCLIDTINSSSYNLRKNGVFYPLNDVPGVEEYLDLCFPYVKEAAMKEDGTVWMLPVAVYMPGLIVQEETLEEMGVSLQRDMDWEGFTSVIAGMASEEKERISLSRMVCSMLFFQQYFGQYNSVDQEIFRQNMKGMQKIGSDLWLAPYREDKRYLFYYVRYMGDYTNPFLKEYYYGENAKVYPMPKLSEGDANTATGILLAVNPASSHLEETLDFIADYVAWQRTEEEAPLFFREPVPAAGSFEAEVYQLYQNGTIAYTVDAGIYLEGFYEMLDGKKGMEEYIKDTERKLKIYFWE